MSVEGLKTQVLDSDGQRRGRHPLGSVTVIHGPNDDIFQGVVGSPVSAIRESLVDAFNVPAGASAYVNGEEVGMDYRVQDNDVLEFVVPGGEKGGHPWGRNSQFSEPDDFYPTPGFATSALLDREVFGTNVWEPACGNGAISKLLSKRGYHVVSSDLVDRDYGGVENFLSSNRVVDSIVTNPPYRFAEEFVRKALASTTFKVAMLLRLSFLESQQRYRLFKETKLQFVYVFSSRLSMSPGGIPTNGRGAVAYAWFVWQHGYSGEPTIRWIPPMNGARNQF